MKPLLLTAAAAFAAGLLPGLLLYWHSTAQRPAEPVQQQTSTASTPVAAAPAPHVDVPQPGNEKRSKEAAPLAAALRNVSLLEQQLQERSDRLAAAEASLQESRSRLVALEARISQLTEQSTQAQESEKALRQEVDAAARQIASLQGELKARETRAAEADAAQMRTLRQTVEAAQKSVAKTAELTAELEDIMRRREIYLGQILTRYREATDLFRAMSLRLDNPRDGGSPLNNDLSRIQQTVQLAEEDLRQLRALSQGTSRVMKEIAAARARK
jgi:chromosome segregation ATPase